MKSSYELAMERLKKSGPTQTLTKEQKAQLADLDSRYKAKIAEREIALQGDVDRAQRAGEREEADRLRQQLAADRASLNAELEEKKEAVRKQKA